MLVGDKIFFPPFSKPVLVVCCCFFSTRINAISSLLVWDSWRIGVNLAVTVPVRQGENSLHRQKLGYLLTTLSVSLTRYLTPPFRECFISHYLGIACSDFEASFVKTIDGRIAVWFCMNSNIVTCVDSCFGKTKNYMNNEHFVISWKPVATKSPLYFRLSDGRTHTLHKGEMGKPGTSCSKWEAAQSGSWKDHYDLNNFI